MSEKTATDELRRMLHERGVGYDRAATVDGGTVATFWYDRDGNSCSAIEGADDIPDDIPDGKVCVQVYITPEQAVDVTLGDSDATATRQGVGTCRMVPSWSEWLDEHTGEECSCGCWKCTACGETVRGGATSDGITTVPRFCPVCGRKVVFK